MRCLFASELSRDAGGKRAVSEEKKAAARVCGAIAEEVENVRRGFEMFDTNRSGDIDVSELRKALQSMGMETDSSQAMAVLQKYDANSNGKLEFVEFKKLVQDLLAFQKKEALALQA